MPVSVSATGIILAFKNDRAVRLIGIADTARLDRRRPYRTARCRWWIAYGRRRMGITKRAFDASAGRRRGLLLGEGPAVCADCKVVVAFFGASLRVAPAPQFARQLRQRALQARLFKSAKLLPGANVPSPQIAAT